MKNSIFVSWNSDRSLMNTSKETSNDQDPDYVSSVPHSESQRKIIEGNARNNAARKITEIIEREFSQEIDSKEKEILQVQEQLHRALKSLHLLRYVIITDYYNRKQCQVSQTEETRQTQMHPAIKQLLGKSPAGIPHNANAPSTSSDHNIASQESKSSSSSTISVTQKKVSGHQRRMEINETSVINNEVDKEDPNNEGPRPRKIPRYIPPKNVTFDSASPSRGIHRKVRKRIVIGNLSKWIPAEWREDAASHKWMMYVRSTKDDNIDDFVSKVRFFLHPSYRPSDVVEVTNSPFHLSRRGWGEFPVRVQLHFKNSLNKPMDVIHHLKLDRTYTGLQTLGSETIVDIWIYTTESSGSTNNKEHKNSRNAKCSGSNIKSNEEIKQSRVTVNTHVSPSKTCEKNNLSEVYDCIKHENESTFSTNNHDDVDSEENIFLHSGMEQNCQFESENINDSRENQTTSVSKTANNENISSKFIENGKICQRNQDVQSNSVQNQISCNGNISLNCSINEASIKQEFTDEEQTDSASQFEEILDSNAIKTEQGCDEDSNDCVSENQSDNNPLIDQELLRYCIALDHDYLGNSDDSHCNLENRSSNTIKEGCNENHEIARIFDTKEKSDHLNCPENSTVETRLIPPNMTPSQNISETPSLVQSSTVVKKLSKHNEDPQNKQFSVLKISHTNASSSILKPSNCLEQNAENRINLITSNGNQTIPTSSSTSIKLSSLNACNIPTTDTIISENLKPLRISIPPTFETLSTGKRILVLKNNQLVSINVPKSKTDDNEKNIIITGSKKTDTRKTLQITEGVSLLKSSRSSNSEKKSTASLTVNTSNTLFLNTNYTVPALQIAVRASNSTIQSSQNCSNPQDKNRSNRESQKNEHELNNVGTLSIKKEIEKDSSSQQLKNATSTYRNASYLKTEGESEESESESRTNILRDIFPESDTRSKLSKELCDISIEHNKVTKTKITLGKDKHKIQSKMKTYEEALKSINLIGRDSKMVYLLKNS